MTRKEKQDFYRHGKKIKTYRCRERKIRISKNTMNIENSIDIIIIYNNYQSVLNIGMENIYVAKEKPTIQKEQYFKTKIIELC